MALSSDMVAPFTVLFDYRCPFARIAHHHVVAGLQAGADWDVSFEAFSLDQSHLEDGGRPVWDEPERWPSLLALEAGAVVRDRDPEHFPAVHLALFDARHVEARDTRKREVVEAVLAEAGADPAAVMAEIEDGWPLEAVRKEHTAAVDGYQAFGVPTFISSGQAAFVRLMDLPTDGQDAIKTVERVIDMLTGWPALNEFKHPTTER